MENPIGTDFFEIQQFRQIWIWAFILPVSLFLLGHFGVGVIKPLFFGEPEEHNPTALVIIARSVSLLIGLGLPILAYKIKMITEAKDGGIYIYFYPFKQEQIPFGDIVNFEARNYNALKEYGGWGIRTDLNGRAYNVSGNRGVQLELAGDKRLLIGSQRSDELARVIQANQDQNDRH